jgi:hypothetical protein
VADGEGTGVQLIESGYLHATGRAEAADLRASAPVRKNDEVARCLGYVTVSIREEEVGTGPCSSARAATRVEPKRSEKATEQQHLNSHVTFEATEERTAEEPPGLNKVKSVKICTHCSLTWIGSVQCSHWHNRLSQSHCLRRLRPRD